MIKNAIKENIFKIKEEFCSCTLTGYVTRSNTPQTRSRLFALEIANSQRGLSMFGGSTVPPSQRHFSVKFNLKKLVRSSHSRKLLEQNPNKFLESIHAGGKSERQLLNNWWFFFTSFLKSSRGLNVFLSAVTFIYTNSDNDGYCNVKQLLMLQNATAAQPRFFLKHWLPTNCFDTDHFLLDISKVYDKNLFLKSELERKFIQVYTDFMYYNRQFAMCILRFLGIIFFYYVTPYVNQFLVFATTSIIPFSPTTMFSRIVFGLLRFVLVSKLRN